MTDNPAALVECKILEWSHSEPSETFKDNYEALVNDGWQLVAFLPNAPKDCYTSALFQRLSEAGKKHVLARQKKMQSVLSPPLIPMRI